MNNVTWITWEHQRRSVELAKAFDAKYYELESLLPFPLRHITLIFKTLWLLLGNNYQVVFAQNPSNVLAALVCFIKKIKGYSVVIDRHSNFIFSPSDKEAYSTFGIFFSDFLSNYSIKHADLTIVTNKFIEDLITRKGGNAFVLPDKLPLLKGSLINMPLKGRYNIVFVSTFSPDEPLSEVLEAAKLLNSDFYIYVTGKADSFLREKSRDISNNVILTGFLNEDEYQKLIGSATLLLTLTTRENTLLCSIYESVSLRKPFIMSDKKSLQEIFYQGNVLTDNTASGIASSIRGAVDNYAVLLNEVSQFHDEYELNWNGSFDSLKKSLSHMVRTNE